MRLARYSSVVGLIAVLSACSSSTSSDPDVVGVMTCPDGQWYQWTWAGDPDLSQEPPPTCADGSVPVFIETDPRLYSPPTSSSPSTTASSTVTTDAATTTTTVPATTTTVLRISRQASADLDGDGVNDLIDLTSGWLTIDDVEIPLPGPRPDEWTELYVVDVDPGDGLLEVALLRWLGEDDHELLIVAYDRGDWFWDRPVRLFNMSTMIYDGSILDGAIVDSSTNCGLTTQIRYEWGAFADLTLESLVVTDADPEPCFG